MRFLHTSDWHLGRIFQGVSLVDEQAHVLDQLVRMAVESRVDAVVVAGDVYDRATPPAEAVELLDDTLTRLVAEHGIPVLVIAGNHDSGERLGFGSRLLGARGLHVAGTVPRAVALGDEHGPVDFLALPFADPAESAARHGDPDIADQEAALRAEAAALVAGLPQGRRRRVAVAHAFVAGGTVSESERPLVLGTAALVGASCFDGFAYAALGHLHRPQAVGRAVVRYSGSLLKYSFDEASHRKTVSLVELDARGDCRIEELALVPRHDVRVVEGTLAELQQAAAADPGRDDYVLARVTDPGAVLDVMAKVRTAYPNCLRVERPIVAGSARDAAPRGDLRRHDDASLFDSFFREVAGRALAGPEQEALADALTALRRTEQEQ